jgi:hypothetical protein
MPRSLTFQLGNEQFECPLIKIDRSKVYGSVQVVTTDHEDAKAELLSLARDGRTLIPLGGTGSGYVNKDGFWVETGERIPVDTEGDPVDVVESSFAAPILLDTVVDEDVLLDHPVRLAYNLGAENVPTKLVETLGKGAIYQFGFSYRGGPVEDPAFLLSDTDGDVWMMVCNDAEVSFRNFKQAAVCVAAATDEVEDDSEDNNFDFDML